MNFLARLFPKPKPELRFYAATRRESEAARRKRTEVHLMLAVENATLPRRELLARPVFEKARAR